MRSLPVRLFALCCFFVVSTLTARSFPIVQSNAGAIRGVVLDPQGAVVVGAVVTATLHQTGAIFTTKSKEDGSFSFEDLSYGDYSLLIAAPGFAKFNTQISLSKDSAESPHTTTLQVAMGVARIDVHMIYIGTGENVCVVCGYTYFSFTYADLPLKSRVPESLLAIQPGVTIHNHQVSIGGRRIENKSLSIDGFDTRDSATGLSTLSLGLDSVGEFNSDYTNADTSVISNYGQNGAPLAASVAKAGTNQYHGQGFWHFDRGGLDSSNFFTNRGALSRDELFFDNAGFSLGGNASLPGVVSGKDRAFFFTSFEQTRSRNKTGRQIVAPVNAFGERTAGIEGPLFASLVSRNRIQFAQPIAGSLKDIDGDGLGDIGDAVVRETKRLSRNLALGRFDLRVNDAAQVEVLYALDESNGLDDFNQSVFTPSSPLNSYQRGELAGLRFTSVLNPRSINDFRVGYLRGITALAGAGSDVPQVLSLNNPLGVGGGLNELPQRREHRSLTFADTFSYVAGSHTVRTGAQVIRRNQLDRNDGLAQGRIYYSDPLAVVTDGSLSTGNPKNAIVRIEIAPESETERYRFYDLYAFAHDDWRATPRFVVNFGTGYNLYSSAIYHTKSDRNNFSPFISFAYAPTHSEKVIIRGGSAIVYAPPTELSYGEMIATPLYPIASGFAARRELVGSTLPQDWISREGAIEVEREFSPDFRTPYTTSSFFAIQQSISDRLIIEVGYFGSESHRLVQANRLDRSIAGQSHGTLQKTPNEETVLIASDGNSSYHSLQVRVTSRERRRLTFQAHYTLSKAIDTASDDLPNMFRSLTLGPVFEKNSVIERGLSDFDRRHRAVGYFAWRGPSLDRSNAAWKTMLGNWRFVGILTFQSGPNVSLYSNGDFFGGAGDFNQDGVLNDRIAYLGSGSITRVIQKNSPADGYFDPQLFGPPVAGQREALGRNILPSPGYGSLDFAIHKKFSITEAHAVEIRADVFNATNRVNFAPPVTNLASSDFGRSVEAGSPRTIRLALKYSF
jgi:hypothetical protein